MFPKLTCQIEITLTLCEPCRRAPCDTVGFGGQERSNGLLVQIASSRVVSSLFADTGHSAAAAPTAWVSRPHRGLLRPECQAGFRSRLRSRCKHVFELSIDISRSRRSTPIAVECLHL